MKAFVRIRDILSVCFRKDEKGMVVGVLELAKDTTHSQTESKEYSVAVKIDHTETFLLKKFQPNQNQAVWMRSNGFAKFDFLMVGGELIVAENNVDYNLLDIANGEVGNEPLTEEQIKNWRDALIPTIGIYALIMPVDQLQKIRDRLQAKLAREGSYMKKAFGGESTWNSSLAKRYRVLIRSSGME